MNTQPQIPPSQVQPPSQLQARPYVLPQVRPTPEPHQTPPPPTGAVRARRFVSLRWRAVFPVLALTLVTGMIAAYILSTALARAAEDSEFERLMAASRAAVGRMDALSAEHRREAARIAYTQGVAQNVIVGDAWALQPLLEPLAAAADLDYVILSDAARQEVLGLRRVSGADGAADYAVTTGTDLSDLMALGPAIGGPTPRVFTAITWTARDQALLTAAPLLRGDEVIGAVIVGTQLDRALELLRGDEPAELALFGPDGQVLRTTLLADRQMRADLALSSQLLADALAAPDQAPLRRVTVGGHAYRAAYIPLVIAGTPLGVVGAYVDDGVRATTGLSANALSLLAAGLVGAIVLATFGVVGGFAARVERVTRTARALASGDRAARTGMQPHDEIGELGAALDRLADGVQRREERLQLALRRQRVEVARLHAVLQAIPDGLIVQDLDGRVLLINDAARDLLGGQRGFREARLHDLARIVQDDFGPALAPGIYALGDPTRVPLDGRVLQAQAAAITVRSGQRIGTVIVVRDMSGEVAREQARDALLDRLSEQAASADQAARERPPESLALLAREVVRNTRAIQRVIAELRDLSTFEPRDLNAGQRPLPLNDLLRGAAAEWDPLARAAGIRLRVTFGPRGAVVLGDERRLRWALGNVLDNAVKYSPPHTIITLRGQVSGGADETGDTAVIGVEDQGYGIAPEDLTRAFVRFARGVPRDADGQPVHKPGTGQGLFIARRVIEAHGGTIALASQPGAGTLVTLRLPLTAPVTLTLPGDTARPPGAADSSQDDTLALSHGAFDTAPLVLPGRSEDSRRQRGRTPD